MLPPRRLIIAACFVLLAIALAVVFTRDQGNRTTPAGPPLPQLHSNGPLVPSSNSAGPVATPEGVAVIQRPGDQPTWAVKYGEEFWRAPVQGEPEPGKLPTGISVTDVAGRGRNRLEKNAEGQYALDGDSFSVEIDRGLRFSPAPKPGAARVPPLVVHTARIDAGKNRLFERKDLAEFLVNMNTAQMELRPGLVEHIEIFRSEVALVTVMAAPPPPGEDMEITWAISGMSYAGEAASRQQFKDGTGKVSVQVGPACAVDAGARKIPRPLVFKDNELSIKLPASFLTTSKFPLAIELIISPL